MIPIELWMLKGHGSTTDREKCVVDWSSAMGMWTTLCHLNRRTTITSQLSWNTAFALLDSEQGLRISSVSSLLKVQTTLLTKGHCQFLMKADSVSCARGFWEFWERTDLGQTSLHYFKLAPVCVRKYSAA